MTSPEECLKKIENIIAITDDLQFDSDERAFLSWLATALPSHKPETMPLSDIQRCLGLDNPTFAQHIQVIKALGWLSPREKELVITNSNLQKIVPTLMGTLSHSGKAIITDQNGLCLFSTNLSDREIQLFSGLTVSLHSTYRRYRMTFKHTTLSAQDWTVDGISNDDLNIWPIKMRNKSLYLLIQGQPKLNRSSMIIITWLICSYYFNK